MSFWDRLRIGSFDAVDGLGHGSRPWRAALLAVFALGLGIRLGFSWHEVFAPDGFLLPGRDPWYYLRLIERWLVTFPAQPGPDPLLLYPDGQGVQVAPLFGFLAAALCWAMGLGQPSTSLIESVAALLPAVLGALCIVPVFVLARQLLGRAGGLGAALLIAVLPGGFLLRTSLGFADHHALEVVLVTAWMAAMVRWLRRPQSKARWMSGLLLGLYLLTWTGGLFALALLAGFLAIQCALDVAGGRGPSSRLYSSTAAMCAAAAVVVAAGALTAPLRADALAGLVASAIGALMLGALARVRRGKPPSWTAGAAALAALALLGTASFLAVLIGLLPEVLVKLTDLADPARQVGEFAPLLYPAGELDLSAAWQQLGPILFPLAIGLPWLIRRWIRQPRPPLAFFLVWSFSTFLAALAANRFILYAAVPAAVLAAAGALWTSRRLARVAAPGRRRLVRTAASALLLSLLTVFSVVECRETFSRFSGPQANWRQALIWLQENSPPALDSPTVDSVGASYGVLAWWDVGYWITAIAQRPPVANPTQQGAGRAAELLLQSEVEVAARQLRDFGVRYVLLDERSLLLPHAGGRYLRGEFAAFARWAGKPLRDYVEILALPRQGGGFAPVLAYKPAYFKSLAVRLFLYAGSSAQPVGPVQVVSFMDRSTDPGGGLRRIERVRSFPTYEQALGFLEGVDPQMHQIVSFDGRKTCLPLPKTPFVPLRVLGNADSSVRIFGLPP